MTPAQMQLGSVPFLSGLSKSEIQAIKPYFKERTLEKGKPVFTAPNRCDGIFIVRKGLVKMFRKGPGAREQILEILDSGDICACHPGNRGWCCSSNAVTLTPCQLWRISRADFSSVLEKNIKLVHALNLHMAKRLRCFSALLEDVSLKDVRKRLIKLLLEMSQRGAEQSGSDWIIHFPYTREETAKRLGTTRETLARCLRKLKNAGLLDAKPFKVIVHNKKELQKLL